MAEIKFSYSERKHEVMYVDAVVFIAGVDVSRYVMAQVQVTLNNRNGWNTATLQLANAEDVWIYTQEQAIAIRKALKGGTIDTSVFRTAARDYRYSEAAKLAVSRIKAGQGVLTGKRLNTLDRESDTWRWEPHPGATCFNKYDPIRIFLHDPRTAETDIDTPAWIPAFTGFLENRPFDDDYVDGTRTLHITAHDVRYFLTRMRVDVNAFTGHHMGNGMIQIEDTLFRDVNSGSLYAHALPRATLEEAVQHVTLGGVQPVDANGKPKGKLRRSRFRTGIGYFVLGEIVQLTPADPPVGGSNTQTTQLTPEGSGRHGNIGVDSGRATARRDAAIAAARKKNEEALAKLEEARRKEAQALEKITSGQVVTEMDTAVVAQARQEARAAQAEADAAASELVNVDFTDTGGLLDPQEAGVVPSVIPELKTELAGPEVLKLERWYALGLFGDWEEDLKRAQALTTTGAAAVTGVTDAAAPPAASSASQAVDSVTGQPLVQPGSLNAAQLAQAGSRGNPGTTTTATQTPQGGPSTQNLVSDADTVSPAGGQTGVTTLGSRAQTGAGMAPAGQASTQNGPATCRLLTWKEVLAIGSGTFWDSPFDPTARKLYILTPKGGTGNKKFADTTSRQTPGRHDRHFISRLEVINNFLAGIDYQWWVSGSGDIFVEPNMLDFQPEDFGKFAPVMKVERHLIRGHISDEEGDIPSAVQAVGALNIPIPAPDVINTRRAQVYSKLAVRRYGIEVKVVSFPFISDARILAAAALTELQKAMAHANRMDVEFAHRPYLLPNKPFYNRVRYRMGTTTTVINTVLIHKEAQTRVVNDHVRLLRYDGRFVLLTGGFDAPISGRRILPADTVYGPPRTGARTNLDAPPDAAHEMLELATAQDLRSPQVQEVIDEEEAREQ